MRKQEVVRGYFREELEGLGKDQPHPGKLLIEVWVGWKLVPCRHRKLGVVSPRSCHSAESLSKVLHQGHLTPASKTKHIPPFSWASQLSCSPLCPGPCVPLPRQGEPGGESQGAAGPGGCRAPAGAAKARREGWLHSQRHSPLPVSSTSLTPLVKPRRAKLLNDAQH